MIGSVGLVIIMINSERQRQKREKKMRGEYQDPAELRKDQKKLSDPDIALDAKIGEDYTHEP